MRKPLTAATLAAAALFALTACATSSETGNDTAHASVSPSATADLASANAAAGIPADPTGAKRLALIDALKTINASLTTDVDKAVSNARNQCSTITGGGNAVATAQARFSTNDHQVTDAEAKAINAALKATLCP